MIESKNMNRFRYSGNKGQAIAEFAIALPVLLLILFGLFEVGRLMFIYSAVGNSSRNAVRYASAFGLGDDGLTKYNNCERIKKVANDSAYLVPEISIAITYDHGLDGSGNVIPFDSITEDNLCNVWTVGSVDTGVRVDSGDRVNITVTAEYNAAVKLIPIPSRTITSTSTRTILGIVDVD